MSRKYLFSFIFLKRKGKHFDYAFLYIEMVYYLSLISWERGVSNMAARCIWYILLYSFMINSFWLISVYLGQTSVFHFWDTSGRGIWVDCFCVINLIFFWTVSWKTISVTISLWFDHFPAYPNTTQSTTTL